MKQNVSVLPAGAYLEKCKYVDRGSAKGVKEALLLYKCKELK